MYEQLPKMLRSITRYINRNKMNWAQIKKNVFQTFKFSLT